MSAVAGALRRRCWYDHGSYAVRPNMFIVLVGTPGTGKGVAINFPYKIFQDLSQPLHGTDLEKEQAKIRWKSFITDERAAPLRTFRGRASGAEEFCRQLSQCRVVFPHIEDALTDASITVITTEFGTFMDRANKNIHMVLTEGWDATDEGIEYHTKHQGRDIIPGGCINWIAGATPDQFVKNMPADAAEQGLLSRIIPVWGEHTGVDDSVATERYDETVIHRLKQDLGEIAGLYGEFRWEPGLAEEVVKPWRAAGEPPRPEDAMMQEYNTRRYSHLRKMCMAISAARRDNLIITRDDWDTATAMLFEVEKSMPKVLRRFGMSDSGKFLDDIQRFVRDKGPVSARVLRREAARISKNPGDVTNIIDLMTSTGMIYQESDSDLYRAR